MVKLMNYNFKQITNNKKYANIFLVISFVFISQTINATLIFNSGFEDGEGQIVFGQAGSHAVTGPYYEAGSETTIYYPTDASAANKVPVVFLSPGWGGVNPDRYKTIMSFIATHGVAVIFAKDKTHWHGSDQVTDYVAMMNDATINPLLDTTRIGVIGHSLGGGHTFSILDIFSKAPYNYGTNGRLLMALEPWFAFDMMQADMLNLPSNTNVVIQQYGVNGFNSVNATDPRIPLTEFYLLESIANNKKDYKVYSDAALDHFYPYDPAPYNVDYNSKQVILAPLDALMQYTFVDSNNLAAHDAALEVGNDDPYADGNGNQVVFPRGDAQVAYPCNGVIFTTYDIDYCDIKGYPYTSKFTAIPTNNATVQPQLLGTSTDLEFGTAITRLTKRIDQQDIYNGAWNGGSRGNHHPYPKTQAWNADMTMIRMNYRFYDADTLQEIPLTTPSGNYPLTTNTWNTADLYYINGALNERKWSTVDPNVFYGVYLSGSNGQFWKGTIDRANNLVSYPATPIHDFGGSFEKFTLGKYEGNISYDDTKVAFAGRKTGQAFLTAIVYDIATDTVLAQKDFDGNGGNAFIEWTDPDANAMPPIVQVFDWMSVSPLGNFIIISTGGNLELYDMALTYKGQLTNEAPHGDFGIAQNGEEVFVGFQFSAPQGIYAERLQKFVDGEPANVYHHRLLPSKYNGGHVSCRNYKRPGWCYLSTTQEDYREVFALRINFADMSNHVVNRFAQTHTFTKPDGSSIGSLVNVSPDGRRVLFFSDWDQAGQDYYDNDTYQVQRTDY